MEVTTPANGRMTASMAKVSTTGLMAPATGASTSKTKNRDVVSTPGLTVVVMKATGKPTSSMAMVFTTAACFGIKDSGLTG